jgi:hypothetical protein
MGPMTKATICTVTTAYIDAVLDPGSSAINIDTIHATRDSRLLQLVTAEKTDGTEIIISPTVTSREWVDQASAEEWVTVLHELDDLFGPDLLVSVEIVDI